MGQNAIATLTVILVVIGTVIALLPRIVKALDWTTDKSGGCLTNVVLLLLATIMLCWFIACL